MPLHSLLPRVEPRERPRFAHAVIAFGCVASAALVARTAGDTVFLSHYGAALLPRLYVGTALVVASVSLGFGWLAGRFRIAPLVTVVAAVLAGVVALCRLALLHPAGEVRIAAYLCADLVVNLPMMLFWGFASLLFDPREGKRLFGAIGAGGTVACIVVGFLVRPFAARFGTDNLFLVVAALLAGFGVLTHLLARREAHRLPEAPAPSASGIGALRELLGAPHVRSLALLTVATTVALVLADFQFKTAARARFHGGELASFFGAYYGGANLAALVLQLFVVHRILRTAGVGAGLSVLPGALLLTSAGAALQGTFAWIVSAKLTDGVFGFTVNGASVQMLFLGVRKQSRGRVRAFVEGAARPLAMAATGALLATVPAPPPLRALGATTALVAAVWLVTGKRAQSTYVAELIEAVGARRFDPADEPADFQDATARSLIHERLAAASDEEVPYLVALGSEMEDVDWRPECQALLRRPHSATRLAALAYLADRGDRSDVEAALETAGDANPEVRRAAIRTVISIAARDPREHERAERAIAGALHDPEPRVSLAAAAGTLGVEDEDRTRLATEILDGALSSDDPALRGEAASALSTVPSPEAARRLAVLLRDPDNLVRRGVLEACRARRDPSLATALLPLLAESGPAAEAALRACGPAALVHLDPALDDPDPAVRTGALRVWARLLGDLPSIEVQRPRLLALMRREVAAAVEIAHWRREARTLPSAELLVCALGDELETHRGNALILLQATTSGVDLGAIERRLAGTGEGRAEALEVLDNLAPADLKPQLLGLFEVVEGGSPVPSDPRPRLLEVDVAPWATAGALYTATESRLPGASVAARRLMGHPDPAVRETALWALARLEPESLTLVMGRAGSDSDPAVRRLSAELAGASAQAAGVRP